MKDFKKLPVLFALAIVFFANTAYSQDGKPLLRFGIIADIQYGNLDTRGTRFYRNSLDKLKDCVSDLNKRKVEFTVNLGDVTDRNPNDLDPVLAILKQLESRLYNTTGNHDYVGITDNQALFKKLGMPSEYYSFKKDKWIFVMLNTNEVASYSNIADTWKQKEYLQIVKNAKAGNAQDYNGGVSSKQLEWLEKILKSARKKDENVLIFSHHPLSFAKGLTALNEQEILDVITKYDCVKAIIGGHYHEGSSGYYKSIPVINVEGMVETKENNAYGIIEIFKNEIVLTGIGRAKSHKLPIK